METENNLSKSSEIQKIINKFESKTLSHILPDYNALKSSKTESLPSTVFNLCLTEVDILCRVCGFTTHATHTCTRLDNMQTYASFVCTVI